MNTSYRFLFLMDPYPTLNLETETSLAMMAELLTRGHRVFWLEEPELYLNEGTPWGRVSEVENIQPFEMQKTTPEPLEKFDALLIRKDPPFNQQYLHLTLLLDQLPDRLMQFNSASALRNFNEKLLPLRWPELSPPTLVSANTELVLAFLKKHKTAVLKPLDDCSGRGIIRIEHEKTTATDIEHYKQSLCGASSYFIAQRFLPEIARGDKRIYLVDGEPVGWVNRVPQPDSFLANIHQGARCEPTGLTQFEQTAIRKIAPFLRNEGIFFAGLDFIGSYLTEINITSPSAIRQINDVMQERIETKLVDGMLDRLASLPATRSTAPLHPAVRGH